MKDMDFALNALMDFPDDSLNLLDRSSMRILMEKLAECRFRRLYWNWFGGVEDKGVWDDHAPLKEPGTVSKRLQTVRNIPDFNRYAVDLAHEMGMDIVGVMRPLESGLSSTYSEFYPEARQFSGTVGIPRVGGCVLSTNAYVREHPEARMKRRTWDIDEEAEKMPICAIELRKQNARPTRIRKEDLTIYVSDNNANYKKYDGQFNFTLTTAVADEDVVVAAQSLKGWYSDGYGRRTMTRKGDAVTAIRLDGFTIPERYVAVVCSCSAPYDGEDQDALFTNTTMQGIRCFTSDGRLIPSAVGNLLNTWGNPDGRDWRECGLGFDMGFGEYFECTLDPAVGEGVFAIARGKERYVHTTLCECDEGVQAYWMDQLHRCIADGFDLISHRVENHSLMMDEPFAYGYNDSVKKLYWERYGKCDEKDMTVERISKVRGDVYSRLFAKGAQIARAAGRKVAVMLNAEMLHDPIPLERRFAYPMTVEWQWERWLEEIRPDEITLRTFRYSPEFVLRDPQCRRLIEVARSYNVPIAYQRYIIFGNFTEEYRMIRDSGLFDSMTLYETENMLFHKGNGVFEERIPGLFDKLKKL